MVCPKADAINNDASTSGTPNRFFNLERGGISIRHDAGARTWWVVSSPDRRTRGLFRACSLQNHHRITRMTTFFVGQIININVIMPCYHHSPNQPHHISCLCILHSIHTGPIQSRERALRISTTHHCREGARHNSTLRAPTSMW